MIKIWNYTVFHFDYLFHAKNVNEVAGLRQGLRDERNFGKPNFVVILADDLGWADVSWNNPQVKVSDLRNFKLTTMLAGGLCEDHLVLICYILTFF